MKLILIVLSILGILLIISPDTTLASFRAPDIVNPPEKGAIPDNSGVYQGTNFVDSLELIINWILGFIGIVVFGIFLFAGFEYATSGGSDDKAKEARSRMANAIIGLIIIFFAFVASNVVLSFVFQDSIPVEEEEIEANINNILN